MDVKRNMDIELRIPKWQIDVINELGYNPKEVFNVGYKLIVNKKVEK